MLAITCPGQGAQKTGFLSSFLELDTFSAQIDELSTASGIDLRLHGTESDDETIKDTAVAQPLLVASAIACAAELGISPAVVAGHSVGEIAAAQIAGIFTPADAMAFVKVRADGMAAAAAATPTGMSAVVGGQPEDVLAAIEAAGASPANVNGGGQTVAAGSLEALEALAENPPERARVISLAVAGAFHTEFMASATADLSAAASAMEVSDPTVSILSNSDGTSVETGREYVDRLVKQVTNPVRWDLCQESLLNTGITGMIELVPGGTLTGIARRAMKGVETFAIKSAADLDGAREFAAAHA
ncbi:MULTISPECIES: ACP S-malonyltransferase [Brevibacterium]|uniref:[acyl-carrier-protein] S-malonyltransferase n=3 Tax=Brevibacterium TaxID=1696 RepID=A0A0B9A060_BRELN|nr:ACP S-malonyltransferase [Brevibacterium linens]AMT93863.1 ACP S-malonyltransferase [Brevibacterium linens]KHS51984.1 (Acyl-carrier-protein) S-malonyltransferase [Brevibacterium linens]HJE76769.1 ACP S-malonyltransferase [Brevibacterium epidermidis]